MTQPDSTKEKNETLSDWKLALRLERELAVSQKLASVNSQSSHIWEDPVDREIASQWQRDQESLASSAYTPEPKPQIVSEETKTKLKSGASRLLGTAKNWIKEVNSVISDPPVGPPLPPRQNSQIVQPLVDDDGWEKFDVEKLTDVEVNDEQKTDQSPRNSEGRRVRFIQEEEEVDEVPPELIEEDRRARDLLEIELAEQREIEEAIKAIEAAEAAEAAAAEKAQKENTAA